jgi:mRNA interferase MazF
MVVNQGDIYWVYLRSPLGSEPGYRHPCVVVQNNLYNQSLIQTIVLCMLTSNLRRADLPGNVLLAPGEGNLERRSVVNVTQIITVDRAQLGDTIGSLGPKRVRQILDGIQSVLEPGEPA